MREGKGVTFKASNGEKISLNYMDFPKEKHGVLIPAEYL